MFALTTFAGCTRQEPSPTPFKETNKLAPKPLNVIFVDIAKVGDEVARQWAAARNSTVTVAEVTSDNLFSDDFAVLEKQDVIVYPSRFLGHLKQDQQILELPDEVWESSEFANRGLLRDCRTTLIRFDDKRWAVPLGDPHLFMLVRNDVLKNAGLDLPGTWDDLVTVAEQLAASPKMTGSEGSQLPTKISLPVQGQYAAHSMLALAAASVRHRGKLNALFDRQTMEPLVASEPFVKALEQLKTLVGSTSQPSVRESIQSFLQGNSSIAIGWPSSTFSDDTEISESVIDNCSVQRLPGSRKWYDFAEDIWKPSDEGVAKVELIGFESFQASILSTNAHPPTAYEFLEWLGSKSVAVNVFSRAPASSPTRASHLGNVQPWTGELLNVENMDRYADHVREINEQPVFLMFPRIRGNHEYISVLSNAVHEYLQGKSNDPAKLLQGVANEWEELTEKYDRNQQKALLRQDFGI